jgi:hypothetical protein
MRHEVDEFLAELDEQDQYAADQPEIERANSQRLLNIRTSNACSILFMSLTPSPVCMWDTRWRNYRGIDGTIKPRLLSNCKSTTEYLVVPALAWIRIGEGFSRPSSGSGRGRNINASPNPEESYFFSSLSAAELMQ